MSKVIRISEKTFRRLQKLAKPLVDTPSDVIGKLLDEHESRLMAEKSEEFDTVFSDPAIVNNSMEINSEIILDPEQNQTSPDLFLAPADQTNVDRTLRKPLEVAKIKSYVSAENLQLLEDMLDGKQHFNCLAMTENKRTTFNQMEPDDVVLISEKGTGKFNFYGEVAGKLISESLGKHILEFTPNKPWKLIYILRNVRQVDIDKEQLVRSLGYSPNYVVPGAIRVQSSNLEYALKYYQGLQGLIQTLDNTKS